MYDFSSFQLKQLHKMKLELARMSDTSGCYRQPIWSYIRNELCINQMRLMKTCPVGFQNSEHVSTAKWKQWIAQVSNDSELSLGPVTFTQLLNNFP